jgi:dolichol-phosphate mannosyltransferase
MSEPSPIPLSIILPCYNEGESLVELLAGYRAAWPVQTGELILVDNGSTDATAEILHRELAKPENAFARMVCVPKNRGYGHGIWSGLQAARGEFLAWSHADLQCPPADLFRGYQILLKCKNPKQTLVKGKRAARSWSAECITNGMSFFATMILGRGLSDINAQPKVFHRDLMFHLPGPPTDFAFDLYVLYRARLAGWPIRVFPVVFGERKHGQSRWAYSLFSRWRTILKMMRSIVLLRMNPRGPTA